MEKKELWKAKIAAMCLVCAVSFPVLGNRQAYASQIQNIGIMNEHSQITNAVNYEEYAQQIYRKMKENINGTEPFIDTGIQVKKEELQDFAFYVQLYFLGKTPSIYYRYKSETPDMGVIQIKRESARTCIEEHDEVLKQLGKIVSDADTIKSNDEKIAYYANLIYESNSYDYSFTNTTAYQLLKNKKGVCHSYTTTFGWLCKLSHIPVVYIEGTMNGMPHAWNQVMLNNGKWMCIDVTNLFISPSKTYIEKEFYKEHFVESRYYTMY